MGGLRRLRQALLRPAGFACFDESFVSQAPFDTADDAASGVTQGIAVRRSPFAPAFFTQRMKPLGNEQIRDLPPVLALPASFRDPLLAQAYGVPAPGHVLEAAGEALLQRHCRVC